MNTTSDGPIEIGIASDIRQYLESIGYKCRDIYNFYTLFIVHFDNKIVCYVCINIDNQAFKGEPSINITISNKITKFSIESPNLVKEIVNNIVASHNKLLRDNRRS